GTVCRPAAGLCDVAETCSGSSRTCPADRLADAGQVCRSAAGDCDLPESCTGSSADCPGDALRPAGTGCPAATGACDLSEGCTGSSATCPPDKLEPDGHLCNDGSACTRRDVCRSGVCLGTKPVVCRAIDECHAAGTCDPATGACSTPTKPDGAPCN